MADRRHSVDLPPDQILSALQLLPKLKGDQLVAYKCLTFKYAPKWEAASPYKRTISKLLANSNGYNLGLTSLTKGSGTRSDIRRLHIIITPDLMISVKTSYNNNIRPGGIRKDFV